MTQSTELYKHPLAILAVAAGIAGLYVVYKSVKGVEKGAEALGNVSKEAAVSIWNSDPKDPNNLNAGSAYGGTGPLGALGNVVNTILFKVPESFGSWSGGKLYDLFHPEYDPNKDVSATDQNRNGNPYGGQSPRIAAAKDRATPDAVAAPSSFANIDWYGI